MSLRRFWRSTFPEFENRFPTMAGIGLVLGALAIVSSGCEESERRAISPGSVSDFATAVAQDDGGFDAIHDDAVPLHQFGQRLLPPAERIYFINGGEIWRVGVRGAVERMVVDRDIVSFSSSAKGDQLAVLFLEHGDDQDVQAILSLLGDDGVQQDLDRLSDEISESGWGVIEAIASTPDGRQMALAYQSGELQVASLDGEVTQIIDGSEDRRPGKLRWSADGRLLAYLDPWLPNESSDLWVAVPELGLEHVLVESGDDVSGIVEAVWIPGTTKLAVVMASDSTIPHGGDLYLVDALTGQRDLLLHATQFSEIAGVVDLAVSPSGDRLAITAFVPGERYPEFRGLWLIDLDGGTGIEIEVEPGSIVTDLWWIADRILFRVIDRPQTSLPGTYTGRETFMLMEYDPVTSFTRERYAQTETGN